MTRSLLVLAAAVLVTGPLAAADWPTVRQNPERTGFTADCVRGPYHRAWVAEFPGEVLATCVEPIVADGRVFVGTQSGTLWALDRHTGRVLWKHAGGAPILHSPAAASGCVYRGDSGGRLLALDTATGRPRWEFRSGKGGFVAAPLVARDTVYLGSRDGSFYAVHAATGRLRWRLATGGPIRGTAALAGDRVVFASDDMRAYAVDADSGRLLWKSEQLVGQSFRDYYPVVLGDHVVLRSVLVEEANDDLNGGTAFLQRQAGIPGGWKELDQFFQSDRNRGTPERIRAEQEAIRQRLADDPYRRTCFVLDVATGRESVQTPMMYIAGNGGCGIPPAVTADGQAVVFYRTVYSNWNRGVKPAVGLGTLDLAGGGITPLRHRRGNTPPWNTFWGTCDESQNFSVGGNLLYLCHQDTLSAFDLQTHDLFPIAGNRDTWGGLLTPIWAANEWHGPARGACAISGRQLFYATGSRVLCIESGPGADALPPAGPVVAAGSFQPSTGTIDSRRLVGEVLHVDSIPDRPTEELRRELTREVRELVEGWPWAPFYLQMGIGSRDFYFAHPSFAVQALALAGPHLPPELRSRARSLARSELAGCLQRDSLPLDRGRRRELFAVPAHDLSWSYHPRWPEVSHLYAVWLYGQRTGDWDEVRRLWPRIQEIGKHYLEQPLAFDARQGAHLFMNRTAAGVVAYARLARRFGGDATPALRELDRLSAAILEHYRARGTLAADTLRHPTSKGDTSGNQGRPFYFHLNNHKSKLAIFLDLTPELGRALAEAAPAETRELGRFAELVLPAYHLAWGERQVHYGENFVDLPDSMHGLFLAQAFLWGRPADRLAVETDLPWVRGDLFHLEKLVHAIEAHGVRR